jgi:arylsulfatase A-like enzyme
MPRLRTQNQLCFATLKGHRRLDFWALKSEILGGMIASKPVPCRLLASLGLVSVLLGACQPSEPQLAPIYLLEAELEGGLRADEREICDINDDFRPAIGCGVAFMLGNRDFPWPEDGPARIRHALPPRVRARSLLIAPRLNLGGTAGASRVPGIFAPAGSETVTIEIPVADVPRHPTLRLTIVGFAIHPTSRRQTRPLEIPADAILTFSLGVREQARLAEVRPIRFRLSAHEEDSTETLLFDETLDAEALRAGWNDRRVDLARLSGRKVSFHFSTEVNEEFSGLLPLWGAPQVLAPVRETNAPNLILISLDTMRADMIGKQLAGRSVTPFLESLIAEGTLFSSALTTFSSTTGAHMSLFTSVYPRVHGVTFPTHNLAGEIPTLARLLSQHGWETAAVTENGMISARSGFARGFRFYREKRENMSLWQKSDQIRETFADGLAWMDAHRRDRFFFFLHTYQTHAPYNPPPEHDLFHLPTADSPGSQPARPEFARYAGEAHHVDAELKKLFAALRGAGILDQTIVIITSDHGEAFGENGKFGHSGPLVEPVMRIPLIVWAPGRVRAGQRVDTQISVLDLMPTILDLVGAASAPASNGHSFAGLLRGEQARELPTLRFAEEPNGRNQTTSIVARRSDRKWIIDPRAGGRVEAFDLGPEGHEKIRPDLSADAAEGRSLQQAFEREIAETRRSFGLEAGAPAEAELDAITAKKLKALGYID